MTQVLSGRTLSEFGQCAAHGRYVVDQDIAGAYPNRAVEPSACIEALHGVRTGVEHAGSLHDVAVGFGARRPGLQPRQLPAHPDLAGGGQPLVDDDIARPVGEDRREDCPVRALDYVPDGRGHGLARVVSGHTRRHRGIASVAASAVLRGDTLTGQAGHRQERRVPMSAKSTRFASKRRSHRRLRREQRDHWPAGIARRRESWLPFTQDAQMGRAYGKCRIMVIR